MTRTPLRRSAAAFAMLVVAGMLPACGGEEPEAAPDRPTTSTAQPTESPSESPSEGDSGEEGRISGAGYTYDLPDGWQDATEQFRSLSPLLDSGALDGSSGGEFSDNVNVIRNDAFPEMGLDEAERQFVAEAETVSQDVRVRERSEIGGVTAIHLSGRTSAGQAEVRTEQYSLYREGAWYIVTFSFAEGADDEAVQADVDTVLGSWQWE